METKIDKSSLLKLTRHLALAYRKLHPAEKEEPAFLIRRRFPAYIMPRQIIQPEIIGEKPVPEAKEEVFELGKITRFTIDKTINMVECSGPGQEIKIRRGASVFLTDLKLTGDEIKNVIQKFSSESKVPMSHIFRANAKGFSITAIISSTGTRFIINRNQV